MPKQQNVNYLRLIKKPYITDKSSKLEINFKRVSFYTYSFLTKDYIKKAVEKLFGVKVLNISTLNTSYKIKTFNRKVKYKVLGAKKVFLTVSDIVPIAGFFDFESKNLNRPPEEKLEEKIHDKQEIENLNSKEIK